MGKVARTSPVFRRYTAIRQECYNPNNSRYPEVGGRGIKCYWTTSRDFSNWVLKNLGPPVNGDQSKLTRIDLDRDYEPGNLKWSDSMEIGNRSCSDIEIRIGRKTKKLREWAREFGVNIATVYSRYLRGWTGRELFEPARKRKQNDKK